MLILLVLLDLIFPGVLELELLLLLLLLRLSLFFVLLRRDDELLLNDFNELLLNDFNELNELKEFICMVEEGRIRHKYDALSSLESLKVVEALFKSN